MMVAEENQVSPHQLGNHKNKFQTSLQHFDCFKDKCQTAFDTWQLQEQVSNDLFIFAYLVLVE